MYITLHLLPDGVGTACEPPTYAHSIGCGSGTSSHRADTSDVMGLDVVDYSH